MRRDKEEVFERSLKAQLLRYPHLKTLTPAAIDSKEEPAVLFRKRLKGYFKADRLCRLWVLRTFDKALERGEPFVKWTDPADAGSSHDGTLTFAHMFTIHYARIHEPAVSVLFDKDGALKNTSVFFQKLVAYIYAYRMQLARRYVGFTCGVHMWGSHVGFTYVVHMWCAGHMICGDNSTPPRLTLRKRGNQWSNGCLPLVRVLKGSLVSQASTRTTKSSTVS